MARLTEEQLQHLTGRLEGQCILDADQVLEEMGLEHLVEDVEVSEQIDGEVFCCNGCGWWSSTEELHNETDENLCEQCYEEEE